ncbi:MAG TPA: threonine synthase, partial [Firmicutes bacterium]|nr:threonine synthase [Bacillota bacterium]
MMRVFYQSTRGKEENILSAAAALKGIAEDGGLFIPTVFPEITARELREMQGHSYQDISYQVMRRFFPDFSEAELKGCVIKAYDDKFRAATVAPLVSRADTLFLELFHGPTLAFKDIALAFLPHLLKTAAQKQGLKGEIVILTATSGDTGKAALEGFADVEGTRIVVFFPEEGVSWIQKRQMVTQEGENVYVIGIKGNFDDAQKGVKEMFASEQLRALMGKKGFAFSSANSINIGRLIPQVAYYFHAYITALEEGYISPGEKLNFAVPTGNFGNILAGYYAKKIGLPVNKLICASNKNNVLTDFFSSGSYDKNREFYLTMSPSMDILVSSNLERLLYDISRKDSKKTRELMELLARRGYYTITPEMRRKLGDFWGGFADEKETGAAIKKVFEAGRYVIDPHTAVAFAVYEQYKRETGDRTNTVVLSTASPFKFPRDVLNSLGEETAGLTDLELP